MNLRWNTHRRHFWSNIGWYGGEPFRLIHISIGETDTGYLGLFAFQVAYFCIAFGLYW